MSSSLVVSGGPWSFGEALCTSPTCLLPQAQPGPEDAHLHLFLVTPPGRGAPWPRALPGRKSRKEAALGGRERQNLQQRPLQGLRQLSISEGRRGAHSRRPWVRPAPGPRCPQASVSPGPCAPLSCRKQQRRAGHTAWDSPADPPPTPQLLPIHRARQGFCSLILRINRSSPHVRSGPWASDAQCVQPSPVPPGFQLTWSNCL